MKRRVVVTGFGLVTSLGNDTEKVWEMLCEGKSGITLLPDEYNVFKSHIAGWCPNFTTDGYIDPKESRRMDRFAQMSLVASVNAVKHSGIDFGKEETERCAVIIGCGVGGLGEIESQQDRLRMLGPTKVMPLTIPKIMLNAASSHVSMFFGIHGPSYGIATACASANNAIAETYKLIRDGEIDAAITGGTESAVCQLGIAGFNSMHALSQRNDNPQAASRPFDKDRDGFVIAEGAGSLVFEDLEHARKRGAEIYGEVLGYGMTSDASHITQPDPEGFYAGRAITAIMKNAGLAPEQIDYINAHGTSTKLGDIAETAAIKSALGEYAYKIPVSSTKSELGHLLGGSGGVELIFSLLSIRDGVIPPTINLEESDPLCDLDYTPLTAREKKVNTVISNSFGFGGHNTCVAVGRFND